MRPFNGLFLGVYAVLITLLVITSRLLRGKPYETRRNVLTGMCAFSIIGFFVYKYSLSLDKEYMVIYENFGGFNWWRELPLQLCNINMMLIPISVFKKNRNLMAFCFFVGTLGAFMALAIPAYGFAGYSILLPRMLGFYGTHYLLIMEALALVTFGLYKPELKDLPGTVIMLFIIAFVLYVFSMFLRWTGVSPRANFFYTVEPEGNAALELFYRWIPCPYLYLLPCAIALVPYMLAVLGIIRLVEKVSH
jgi:hypothetical integral membrane protein (TIGR02206 family)